MLASSRAVALALSGCLALSGLAVAAGNSGSGTQGPIYKWVDAQGVIHYGDSVPADSAQTERAVLNSEGVEVGHVQGRMSPAAQAAADAAAAHAQAQAQHDQFLLSTYVSAKDIEQLRDERLDQLDGQIKAASSYIDTLTSRLGALQERAMRFKPYSDAPDARRMPDDLAEELVHTANEAHSQREALEAKRKEQTDVRDQFAADIARYRELTSHPRS